MIMSCTSYHHADNEISGQQFAIIEAAYTTIRLCQAFSKIEARDDGGPWTESLTLTCAVGQGVRVAVTKRV